MMHNVVMVIALFLPTLIQPAASTATQPTVQPKKAADAMKKMFERIRQEQLQASMSEKKAHRAPAVDTSTAANRLAQLWTQALPTDDFKTILKSLHQALGEPINDTLTGSSDSTLIESFLRNDDIAHRLCNAPLFARIDSFLPAGVRHKRLTFNEYSGSMAVETETALYLFNGITKITTVIPHAPTGAQKIDLLFSYDGKAIARINHTDTKQKTTSYNNTVAIYSAYSGALIYVTANVSNDFKASPTTPLFMHTTTDNQLIAYNYANNTEFEIPLVQSEEILINPCIKISPCGTYAAFLIEYAKGARALVLHTTTTKQRFYFPITGITNCIGSPHWHDRVTFNKQESMISFAHDSNTIQLFKTSELTPKTLAQKPYAQLDDYEKPSFGTEPQFSPDGTQLLVPQADGSFYLYDLITQQKWSPHPETVAQPDFFVAPDAVLLKTSVRARYTRAHTLLIRSTQKRITVGDSVHFFEKKEKLAYTKPDNFYLLMRDSATGAECLLKKEYGSRYFSDHHENLWCAKDNFSAIEQLIIDPTSCTLDQLFFLLGIVHTVETSTQKAVLCKQLLNSPLLATFPQKAHDHLQHYLEKLLAQQPLLASAAPARFSITQSLLKIAFGSFVKSDSTKNA